MRRLWYYIRVALSGHLLNPLWLPRLDRRRVRGRAYRRAGMDYLRPYAAAVRDVPVGACPECGGLGKIIGISEDLVIPDKTKTIYDGAVACWRGDKMSWFKDLVVKNAEKYDIPVFTPYCKLTEEQKKTLWTARSNGVMDESAIVGIDEFFEWVNQNRYKIQYKYMLSRAEAYASLDLVDYLHRGFKELYDGGE